MKMFDWKPLVSFLEKEGYHAKVYAWNVLCVTHSRFQGDIVLESGQKVPLTRRQVQIEPHCLFFNVMDGHRDAKRFRKLEDAMMHVREFLALPEGDMDVMRDFYKRSRGIKGDRP